MITQGLVLPQRLETDQATLTNTYGRFIAEPFEKGYGHTTGNSLRRILLSSLEGAAVTSVRVKGAMHEFTSLKGVREDVIHIILNLKKLRVKLYGQGPETLTLKIRRQGEIFARDIEPNNQVEILTPDLVIATLDDGADLEIEMEVSKGRGYVSAERLKKRRPAPRDHPDGRSFLAGVESPLRSGKRPRGTDDRLRQADRRNLDRRLRHPR